MTYETAQVGVSKASFINFLENQFGFAKVFFKWLNNIHTWQMLPQLSCINFGQIRKLYTTDEQWFNISETQMK